MDQQSANSGCKRLRNENQNVWRVPASVTKAEMTGNITVAKVMLMITLHKVEIFHFETNIKKNMPSSQNLSFIHPAHEQPNHRLWVLL